MWQPVDVTLSKKTSTHYQKRVNCVQEGGCEGILGHQASGKGRKGTTLFISLGPLAALAAALDFPLAEYTHDSENVLSVACAHLEGSGLPIGGAGTHVVLSAHRGLPSVRLFTGLDMLKAGGRFRIVIRDERSPMKLTSSASSCRQIPTTSRSRKLRTTAHCSPVRRMASICSACWRLSYMFA